MRMVEHEVTAGGSVIATYEPSGDVATGSFETIQPSAAERARRTKIAEGAW
jgi:hypothetical protein